jgi:hypothetical protein
MDNVNEKRDQRRIEAYGVKGMKSTPWRKTFNSTEQLNAWVERNDAEVHATRLLGLGE